mmetsp:Transcript_47819/g.95067  ORF Transcript_47819/g.95067 Transcript_47819/m.95067 type:complete len:385 (+) Transcript_47819:936-2090(+)
MPLCMKIAGSSADAASAAAATNATALRVSFPFAGCTFDRPCFSCRLLLCCRRHMAALATRAATAAVASAAAAAATAAALAAPITCSFGGYGGRSVSSSHPGCCCCCCCLFPLNFWRCIAVRSRKQSDNSSAAPASSVANDKQRPPTSSRTTVLASSEHASSSGTASKPRWICRMSVSTTLSDAFAPGRRSSKASTARVSRKSVGPPWLLSPAAPVGNSRNSFPFTKTLTNSRSFAFNADASSGGPWCCCATIAVRTEKSLRTDPAPSSSSSNWLADDRGLLLLEPRSLCGTCSRAAIFATAGAHASSLPLPRSEPRPRSSLRHRLLAAPCLRFPWDRVLVARSEYSTGLRARVSDLPTYSFDPCSKLLPQHPHNEDFFGPCRSA